MTKETKEAYKELKFKWYSARKKRNFIEADRLRHFMKNLNKK